MSERFRIETGLRMKSKIRKNRLGNLVKEGMFKSGANVFINGKKIWKFEKESLNDKYPVYVIGGKKYYRKNVNYITRAK